MAPNQVDLRICESGERESARACTRCAQARTKDRGANGWGRGDWDSVTFPVTFSIGAGGGGRGGRGGNGSNVDAILLPRQRWAAMWCHGGMTLALSGWTIMLLTLVLLLCWYSVFPVAN